LIVLDVEFIDFFVVHFKTTLLIFQLKKS